MEVERQKYETVVSGEKGKERVVAERKVGGVEKFEFGGPADAMTAAIGGGFTTNFYPDFLRQKMGDQGVCARFYFDRRVAVDIGDPKSEIVERKRKYLFRNGFGYLCIPVGFPQDVKALKALYKACLEEYKDYEARHPRPAVVQETLMVDSKGQVRKAMLTAIDIKVGGGVVGQAEQARELTELKNTTKLSHREVKELKNSAKLRVKIRECLQSGAPFRNPFVAPGVRKYNVQYAAK
jgi:hypothetical protein